MWLLLDRASSPPHNKEIKLHFETFNSDRETIPNPQLDKISQIGDWKKPNWGLYTQLSIFLC